MLAPGRMRDRRFGFAQCGLAHEGGQRHAEQVGCAAQAGRTTMSQLTHLFGGPTGPQGAADSVAEELGGVADLTASGAHVARVLTDDAGVAVHIDAPALVES